MYLMKYTTITLVPFPLMFLTVILCVGSFMFSKIEASFKQILCHSPLIVLTPGSGLPAEQTGNSSWVFGLRKEKITLSGFILSLNIE